MASTKITNIGRLIGFSSSGAFTRLENCEMLVKNGEVSEISQSIASPAQETISAEGAMLTPSFVDPHSHIFTPIDRAEEFALRPIKSYEEIAAAGGGILSSMRAAREASPDELFEANVRTIERFFRQGTTTLEMKSGYGLSLDDELKLLRVIRQLQTHFSDKVEIVPTFLGAHAFPPEFRDNRDGYVDLIVNEMIPAVAAERLAEYVDSFCEIGYFSVEQTERIFLAAKESGMELRVHADEFLDSGAAELAARLNAHSADHLMAVSDSGIQALASAGVVATILPGTTLFLGKSGYAPARKLIEAGCTVALATDLNPGSSVFQSQPLMMNLAMNYTKMSLEEAFQAVTRNAALSLNRPRSGVVEIGAQADFIFWSGISELAQIPYYNVESRYFIKKIMKRGKLHEIDP